MITGADRARPPALSLLALLEDAFLLGRSLRNLKPVRSRADGVEALVSAALTASSQVTSR
ncbi:MAG: hypothetical protein JO243_03500 [Solirubrobacterales bacterium]|nr:hypothetical protein [Solirubrobacterales bacterium]